ncbi:MAG: hypothetical protein ABIO36_02605 [Pyrinomonadaceae bacterium]
MINGTMRRKSAAFSRIFWLNSFVISGFNTDIDFGGTVYHVQTEDKGLQTRVIMSLVYHGGTILASKRSGYDDLEAKKFDEKELSDRVSRQHKLICAAVKAGRIGELKEMTAKSAAAGARARAEATAARAAIPAVSTPITAVPVARVETDRVIQVTPPDVMIEKARVMAARPVQFTDELVIDAVHIIEDHEILPAEAVEVVSELSGQERPTHTKLNIELLGETKFKGGDRRTVNIMICRGTERRVVGEAQIMIKVVGSSFRPVIFHAKSDPNGLARIHLQLPHFQAGRAALLVRAITGGEEIELRRVVTPG